MKKKRKRKKNVNNTPLLSSCCLPVFQNYSLYIARMGARFSRSFSDVSAKRDLIKRNDCGFTCVLSFFFSVKHKLDQNRRSNHVFYYADSIPIEFPMKCIVCFFFYYWFIKIRDVGALNKANHTTQT
jgi:hypothetical protein